MAKISESDIYIDASNELLIENGDIVIKDNIEYHVGAITKAEKGMYKQFPTLGAGLTTELDSPSNYLEMEQKIRTSLKSDGYRLDELQINTQGDNVTVDITKATKTTDQTQGLL